MQGLHLTADLHNCRCAAAWLTDAGRLHDWCMAAVRSAGLHAVNQLFHAFPSTPQGPGGVTAAVLLAESHLCLHTWLQQKAVTLDVYVSNIGDAHLNNAQLLMQMLVDHFVPQWTEQRSLDRGDES